MAGQAYGWPSIWLAKHMAGQASGQAYGQTYDQPYGQAYDHPCGQAFDQVYPAKQSISIKSNKGQVP